jgi:hypothetical protein
MRWGWGRPCYEEGGRIDKARQEVERIVEDVQRQEASQAERKMSVSVWSVVGGKQASKKVAEVELRLHGASKITEVRILVGPASPVTLPFPC